jgi:hypothetical protein
VDDAVHLFCPVSVSEIRLETKTGKRLVVVVVGAATVRLKTTTKKGNVTNKKWRHPSHWLLTTMSNQGISATETQRKLELASHYKWTQAIRPRRLRHRRLHQ